jgi:hypothetical protein
VERIPWPTTHAGLTPADIPGDYSAFTTIFDDHRGYEPRVVGRETNDDGRIVILVAISPGAVIPITLVDAGADPGAEIVKVVAAVNVLRLRGSLTSPPKAVAATSASASDQDHRED